MAPGAVKRGIRTFRARSTTDLALPVQQALAAALVDGAGGFRLVLEPGDYRGFALSLRGPVGPGGVDLTVEGVGGRPVVLDGCSLSLEAHRVTVRNVMLYGHRGPGPALALRFDGEMVGERLAVVGTRRQEESEVDPVVLLTSAGSGGVAGVATLSECWFLDNVVPGGVDVLATPRSGRGYLEALNLERCVFAGNVGRFVLHPWFTRRLTIAETLVAEAHATRGWLAVTTPLVRVEVTGGLTAVAGPFVEYVTGPDVARVDLQPVAFSGGQVHLGAGVDLVGLALDGADVGAPLALSPDLSALERAARDGERPDPEALLRRLTAREVAWPRVPTPSRV